MYACNLAMLGWLRLRIYSNSYPLRGYYSMNLSAYTSLLESIPNLSLDYYNKIHFGF